LATISAIFDDFPALMKAGDRRILSFLSIYTTRLSLSCIAFLWHLLCELANCLRPREKVSTTLLETWVYSDWAASRRKR